MHNFWNNLTPAWQTCLELAWEAYCAGSIPIGAVIADAQGVLLSKGRNRIREPRKNDGHINSSTLAHAELNALIALPYKHPERHTWSLYTTTEPCPMCLGALYMSGLRQLHYAARDPWAGSANLLGTTTYMKRKQIRVEGPFDADLEAILVTLTVVVFLYDQDHPTNLEFLACYRDIFPDAVQFGGALFGNSLLEQMRADHTPVPEVYNELAYRWHEFVGAN